MHALTVEAAAKINWTLDITGTDERGYHLLDTVMQRITLFDTVRLKKTDAGIEVFCSDPTIPVNQKNTAYRAAELFLKETGAAAGCVIDIEKRILCGAGMGGGSADAAAVLLGLNHLFGGLLQEEQIEKLALRVGADVPFMLKGGAARVQGIGEKRIPLQEIPEKTLLCVMRRELPASTALVYQKYDVLGSDQRPENENFVHALVSGNTEEFSRFGGNVLQPAAQALTGAVNDLIQRMKKTGAKFSAMTGSGSAVFGVFETPAAARTAEKEFDGMWHCVCSTTNEKTVIKQEGKE